MNRDNLEKMISVSKGIRADIHDETRAEINGDNKTKHRKTNKVKMTTKGKAVATAFLVSIAGWIGVGHVKEYKYQKAIDKYNEETLMIVPPKNLKLEEEEQKKSVEYLSAVFSYLNDDLTESEKEERTEIIDKYVCSGEAIELEEKVMARQLDIAKKLGDAKHIDRDDLKETKLKFYNSHEYGKEFTISGVSTEHYKVQGLQIFENDVPDNLIQAAKDCINYRNRDWGFVDKEERVEVGIQIAKNTETMMNEHYVITDDGIERINNSDFKDLVEEYNDKADKKTAKQREEFYNEYGFVGEKVSNRIEIDEQQL